MEGKQRTMARVPLERVVAAHLRKRRRALRLSREALAQQSDVSEATLARMEEGDSSITIVELEKVACAMGVTSSDLMRRDEARDIRPAKAKDSARRKSR
jgi:transcriptional regulator with XRE-family HTH domain